MHGTKRGPAAGEASARARSDTTASTKPTDGGAARKRLGRRQKAVIALSAVAVAGIVAALVAVTGSPSTQHSPPAIAKNFTLPELGHPGKKISLAALAGRPVIINFFASWCPPCRTETPLLARFYRSEHGKVLVIGVDSNDVSAKAIAFVRAEGVSYPVASDPFPAPVTISYGVVALPQTFFLNARHDIVRHVYGDLTAADLTSWAHALGASGG